MKSPQPSNHKNSLRVAFLFPGSGNQYLGMGKDLSTQIPLIKKELSYITELLGYDLTEYMFKGPKSALFPKPDSPIPTIFIEVTMALSLAVASALRQENIIPNAVAGRSMGEYSAYTFANLFDIPQCFLLARTVLISAQADCLKNSGNLFTIYGLNFNEIQEVVNALNKNKEEICEIAIFYKKPKIAVLGMKNALIEPLKKLLSKYRHTLSINKEGGAFHTSILSNCVKKNMSFFNSIKLNQISYPLYTNYSGKKQNSSAKLKTDLLNGLSHRVKWQETIENMLKDGIRIFVEMAPGAMLTEFICNMPKDAIILRTDTPENYKKTLEFLKENSRV